MLRSNLGHYYSSGPIAAVQEESCYRMLNGIVQQPGGDNE